MQQSKQWYESLFEHYADSYDHEPYVQGTVGEVDFIEQEVKYNKAVKILDIGCGTGRHSVELARRGYDITGVDLSEEMLAKAVEKAVNTGVSVRFQQGNALHLKFSGEFDLAIMLCEGAFPLMETDELNYRILQNAYNSLTEGGTFIFTTYNGLYALFHSPDEIPTGGTVFETDGDPANAKFDLMTFRMKGSFRVKDKNGIEHEFTANERYYMPSEISLQLKFLGFKAVEIFGAKLGSYSRLDVLTKDDYEMLVVTRK